MWVPVYVCIVCTAVTVCVIRATQTLTARHTYPEQTQSLFKHSSPS